MGGHDQVRANRFTFENNININKGMEEWLSKVQFIIKYWKFFSLNVSIMTLPLFKKLPCWLKKLLNYFFSSIVPQAICGLLLHYHTICGFPKPKIFQQNRGLAGCRQRNQSCRLFLPVVWKSIAQFSNWKHFHHPNCKGSATALCSPSANVNVPSFSVLFWHFSLHYFVRRGNRL